MPRDFSEQLGPAGLAGFAGDLILPHFDAEVGDAARFGVAVHRRVEQLARIGLLVADYEPIDREERIERFYRPYHAALASLLHEAEPSLILSLHSFTPGLRSRPEEQRPWQVGVLYNADDRAARRAIPLLEADGLVVGDQQPYSGKLLNATMNLHAEAHGRPYVGIEVRQDQLVDVAGQAAWAERLVRIANEVARNLE